jgi:acetyl-CoA synthetase
MADRIPPPASTALGTHCTPEQYRDLYARSLADPDGFWAEQARRIDWVTPPSTIANWSYDPVDIKWFEDGVLNLCHNCVDRHLAARSADIAIVFEGDEPGVVRTLSYGALYAEVVRMANCLKALGAGKGDRVTLYMPMIPEAAVAMLACARIGAVHSVVFGGFSPEALHGRIEDCASRFVITADGGKRGGKLIPLKANVDAALDKGTDVAGVIVVRHLGNPITMREGRDHWYDELGATVPADCPCEPMGAEDPLFILYTSGSTGKPKGVLHTTGGYAVWTATTFHYVFDYRPGELFWCTADVGWVTGHSYVVYGPLANGATTLMFEGVPNHPDFSRFWDVIERHKVNIFYTAPTAIRALMREGDAPVKKHDRSSLRLLGSVGEPINPEAWLWYWRVAGDEHCPVVDTWWQTETGGIMITTLPAAHDMKPGSAGKPFFGIVPELVDAEGKTLEGAASGNLCIARSWPGQMRSVYGDHDRFVQTYFSAYRGKYFTGDGCRRDADDYYWITGRVDDVLNISGHRLGTAEIESALVSHPLVAEAAVVGYPHDIKGTGIYCYVTLNAGVEPAAALEAELKQQVRTEISAIATPDLIHFTPALPKTRSGKIMRRILRKIAENDYSALGDTSTLADPSLVDDLIDGRRNRG